MKLLNKRNFLIAAAIGLGLLIIAPLFAGRHFVSLDGAAHVYNARLMNEMLFGQSSAGALLHWNFPVPNASGHFALQLLLLVFPAFVAEKIFVGLLLLLLPLGAARLIKKSGGNAWMALFFVPLGYSVFIGLGFYNFLVGVVVLLFLMSVIVSIPAAKTIPWVALVLLWATLYFSHVLVLFTAAMLTALFWLIVVFRLSESLSRTARSLLPYALPPLPFVIAGLFFMSGQHSGTSTHLPPGEILRMFRQSDVLAPYAHYEHDGVYIFTGILVVFLLFTLFFLTRRRVRSRQRMFFAAGTLFLLALVFILPDGNDQAGYVTIRLIFLATLAFLLFVAMLPETRLQLFLVLPLMACQLILSARHFKAQRGASSELSTVAAVGEEIPSGSTVLLIDTYPPVPQRWIMAHRYALLAQRKDVLVFNNYETMQSYFPLTWREDLMLELYYTFWKGKNYDGTIRKLTPDYVVVQAPSGTQFQALSPGNGYHPVYRKAGYTLYERL